MIFVIPFLAFRTMPVVVGVFIAAGCQPGFVRQRRARQGAVCSVRYLADHWIPAVNTVNTYYCPFM